MSEPAADSAAAEPGSPGKLRILGSIGPAIITASVVLGPGSILTSSRVGAQYGYQMLWVPALAAVLMWAMVALAARLGAVLGNTPCEEVAHRLGRFPAILVGGCLFLVAACFQFSNNLGIYAAIEPLIGPVDPTLQGWQRLGWPDLLVLGLNLAIIGALFGFKHLYRPVEILMMVMVGLMILGFLANLGYAKPDPSEAVRGLVPTLPPEAKYAELVALFGLVGTTFSVGGAFYQAYLVRQKGWGVTQLRQGMIDSAFGIAILGGITLVIMMTAASVLFGKVDPASLQSAADVALQLEPLFGQQAVILFCLGIFAGAFSSFLVNALIGGSVLSDGLGLGGSMDNWGPRVFTVFALLLGMAVAIGVRLTGQPPVPLILFAQAMTVLGNPILAATLLYLAFQPDLTGQRFVPTWMKGFGIAGFLVVTLLAIRTLVGLVGRFTG